MELNNMSAAEIRSLIKQAHSELEERERRERSFYVWAKTDNPEHLRSNAGIPDIVLSPRGMTSREAEFLASRLRTLGIENVEVRQS